MNERAHAATLAHKLLDKPHIDPDGDASVLARQLLRERERTEALRQAAIDFARLVFVERFPLEDMAVHRSYKELREIVAKLA